MADPEHLYMLMSGGATTWNNWREQFPDIKPDFSGADLSNCLIADANFNKSDLTKSSFESAKVVYSSFMHANLSNAHCRKANFTKSDFNNANLRNADLAEANLTAAYLMNSDLRNANLKEANLSGANFSGANLSGANLRGASLVSAIFIQTDLSEADLSNCYIYGIAAWDLKFDNTVQKDIRITPLDRPIITVDNIEIAQFIYLILKNEKIRDVINTITSKMVLILGRFSPKRKSILDAIREELRNHDYVPVLFDFQEPASRDLTETISILAHMSRFIIVDLTDAKSIPQELQSIVPGLPSVAVKPLLQRTQKEYGLFEHLQRYPWVLKIHKYDGLRDLISSLEVNVISPAEKAANKLKKTS